MKSMGCATNEHYKRLILLAPVTLVDLSHVINEHIGWLTLLALVTPLHHTLVSSKKIYLSQ